MALAALVLTVLIGCKGSDGQDVSEKTVSSETLKPNIIFILTDDLGYGDLGVLFQNQRAKDNHSGTPREFTPHLDKMADEGALLPQHYAAAPVCAPSRASLLSGRSQGHANVRDNQFDKALEDNLTMASALQEAGYSTAAIGKWGLQGKGKGPDWPAHPLNRGFDYYLGYIRHGDGHEHYPKEGIYRGSKEVYENRTDIADKLDKCYTADLWTAAAKKWIVDHKKKDSTDAPFFMYLAYDTPHAVLELPTQPYPKGAGLNGGLQWTGEPGHMINTASGDVDSWIHPDYATATYDHDGDASTQEEPWPEVYKRYATDTRRIDSAIGDIIQLLKDLDIDENTLIVFSSDNGPSRESYLKGQNNNPSFFKSFGPFDGIKRDTWEGGLRMPTIARWPGGIPAGQTISTASISYDWMPTFIEMAGLPVPAISDGVSLVPSLTDDRQQEPSHIYVEYYNNRKTPAYDDFLPSHKGRKRGQMQMLRFGDTVGVRYDIQNNNEDFEVYEVIKDPQQSQNLAEGSDMQDFQARLKNSALRSRIANSSAERPYDKVPVPAVEMKNLTAGISWKAFKGDFPWVPELSKMAPAEEGVMESPNANESIAEGHDALYHEGYLKIPEEGEYTFHLTTSGPAVLRIHEALVIDADHGHTAGGVQEGSITLSAGLHPFRLYSLVSENEKSLMRLEWSGSGKGKMEIPANVFFRRKIP